MLTKYLGTLALLLCTVSVPAVYAPIVPLDLSAENFLRLQPGMTQADVLRVVGPVRFQDGHWRMHWATPGKGFCVRRTFRGSELTYRRLNREPGQELLGWGYHVMRYCKDTERIVVVLHQGFLNVVVREQLVPDIDPALWNLMCYAAGHVE